MAELTETKEVEGPPVPICERICRRNGSDEPRDSPSEVRQGNDALRSYRRILGRVPAPAKAALFVRFRLEPAKDYETGIQRFFFGDNGSAKSSRRGK